MSEKVNIPCLIMRGGTSKGLYFLESDLPSEQAARDKMLLEIMGSPDKKQIDGLGGATSVTSKVAIIAPSQEENVDVNYTFAQVSVDKPIVSYKGNCGNISSAVGPFAIEKGLVKAVEPVTKVRIYNTNTQKVIVAEVCVKNGKVVYDGDFAIAGVVGTAAPVKLNFLNPAGSVSGKLLPTGNCVDELDVPELGKIKVSIVDAANPLVFVTAESVGLTGTELPAQLDADDNIMNLLETIRGMAAVKMGLIEDYKQSAWETPGIPKMTIVAPPASYVTSSGENISKDEIDICSKMLSMQKTHPSYAMTGAMCTVAAATVKGSIVNSVCPLDNGKKEIRIGHCSGILPAGVDYQIVDNEVSIEQTYGYRTANLLMEGSAYCHLPHQ